MTGPLIYPPADHTTQWVGKGSVTMPMDHVKWLQHTTETAGGFPPYDYGGVYMGSAPTLTYEPWQHKWRQHFEINQSARALQNDGSFYTNRVDVVQTEISCYCDHSLAQKYGHSVNDLDDQAINDLGDFGAWLVKYWGLKPDSFYPAQIPWPAYPHGCTRLTTTAFANFSGIVGHMAAPGNSHLDPGDLDNTKVKARMDGNQGGNQGGGDGVTWDKAQAGAEALWKVRQSMNDAVTAVDSIPQKWQVIEDARTKVHAAQAAVVAAWTQLHEVNYPKG